MSDGTEHSLYHKPSRALADILTDVIQRACLIRADVLQRQLADTFASVVCPRTQDDCSIAILARPGKALRIVDQLSVEERRRLYHIQRARAHTARRIRRYDAMLVLLEQPHSLRQIAVKIHLNPRYTKQRLGQLEQLGLIEQTTAGIKKREMKRQKSMLYAAFLFLLLSPQGLELLLFIVIITRGSHQLNRCCTSSAARQ